MKRLVFILFLLAISCKESTDLDDTGNFSLVISLDNVSDGTKVYLRKQEDQLSIDLDSTQVNNGSAFFTGTIAAPEVYGLFIDGQKTGIFPIIEKGQINIQANLLTLDGATISGSPLNDKLADYKKRVQLILSKTNEFFHDFQKARAENDLNTLKKINDRIKDIHSEKVNYSVRFIKDNRNSLLGSMVLHSLVINKDLPNQTLNELYLQLTDQIKKSEFSKAIEIELKLDSIGQSPIDSR